MRGRGVAPVLLAALAASCGGPPAPPPWASAGSSIALARDGLHVWVTSPDDDTVVGLDPSSLAVPLSFAVPCGPSMLVETPVALVVTCERTPDVVYITPADGTVSRVEVPCGGTRGLASDADGRVYVACPNDDRVLVVDPPTHALLHVIDVPGRPTAIAVLGEKLFVTERRLGQIASVPLATLSGAGAHVALASLSPEELPLEATSGHAASQLDALSVDPGTSAVLAAWQRVENDGDRLRPAAEGGYGALLDGSPRIEPRVLAPCGGRYAHFDGGVRAASGPSAVALAGGVLWVAHLTTDSVLAFACPAGADVSPAGELAVAATEPVLLGAFRMGRGPRGLAVSADGRTAYVDVGFDHAVAKLSLASVTAPTAATPPDLARTRPLGATAMSASALAGRSLFFDAVNTHLTPSGVVTCGTCHPSGGDDGLSWFLHTTHVGPKLRRTPAAWGARPSLVPFHWDGEFTDAATLSHGGIVELMNGDALLVDTSAMAAYMAELPPPPPRPLDATEQASAARGATLFASATTRCATCHSGPELADGLRHATVPATTDPDATLLMVDTPGLVAVRARGPYLHDGRAATLRDVVTTANPGDVHGVTSTLTPAELDDLVQYLDSL